MSAVFALPQNYFENIENVATLATPAKRARVPIATLGYPLPACLRTNQERLIFDQLDGYRHK
jgi:hypothetical protein